MGAKEKSLMCTDSMEGRLVLMDVLPLLWLEASEPKVCNSIK